MESQHKLYLFGGHSYVLVPESAWLAELKQNPTGTTVLKTIEESLVLKGWIKTRQSLDSKSHASETEWISENGARLRISVDANGQLKVNGKAVGSTTAGETFKQVEKIAEEGAKGKWITAVREVTNEKGQKVLSRRRIYIPPEKVRKPPSFVPGKDARKPEDITGVGREKGGPHPTVDVLGQKLKFKSLETMNQVLGQYSPPILKEKPSKAEAVKLLRESGKIRSKNPKKSKELARRAFKIFQQLRETKKAEPPQDKLTEEEKRRRQEALRTCNLMLELAAREENLEERKRLCEEVEKELAALEAR